MILRLRMLCQGEPTFSLRDPGQKTWGDVVFPSDPRYPVLRFLVCVLGFWRPLVLSPQKTKWLELFLLVLHVGNPTWVEPRA